MMKNGVGVCLYVCGYDETAVTTATTHLYTVSL
jgi:hypothetical protein